MLCLQEDLRAQLRKMEAGASDKDKVEAPNGIMEMCSISFSIAQTSARRGNAPQQYLCCAFPGFVWNYQDVLTFSIIFLQCMTFGAKMLRVLLFLGWTFMNVARHDKAWYHYKDVCACWESMRLSSLHRLAISSNSIKTYLLQSIWQGQHVLVIKNDSGRAPFSRGNYISHHRPSTNVDSMAFPQTCQIARVRGRPKRS